MLLSFLFSHLFCSVLNHFPFSFLIELTTKPWVIAVFSSAIRSICAGNDQTWKQSGQLGLIARDVFFLVSVSSCKSLLRMFSFMPGGFLILISDKRLAFFSIARFQCVIVCTNNCQFSLSEQYKLWFYCFAFCCRLCVCVLCLLLPFQRVYPLCASQELKPIWGTAEGGPLWRSWGNILRRNLSRSQLLFKVRWLTHTHANTPRRTLFGFWWIPLVKLGCGSKK